MRFAIDTETTGVDFQHGSRPFLVTITYEDETCEVWEWDVDPYTRMPIIPHRDSVAVCLQSLMGEGTERILHNAKFDVKALGYVHEKCRNWLWDSTHDTLIASHVLSTNSKHDLTSLSIRYLGIDLTNLESALEKCVKECRRLVRSKLPEWNIAGTEEAGKMSPSITGEGWRSDYWLPRAYASYWNLRADHPYRTVLREYAESDSAITLMLWGVMEEELKRRNLWEIYLKRMEVIPIAHAMECAPLTVNGKNLDGLRTRFSQESAECETTCIRSAQSLGYQVELPKSGVNNSLQAFAEAKLVPPDKWEEVLKTETGKLSLSKDSLEILRTYWRENSRENVFIRKLVRKRSLDTALAYMKGYNRFLRPTSDEGFYALYPSLNPTGTRTLRWSSSNPNEQNISKREGLNLRECFGPSPGYEWWSCDAKNIEARLPAYESGEEELIDLYERPDDPPYYGSQHLLNFSTVYDEIWKTELAEVGIEKVGPHCKKKFASTYYQWCKNGGFAVQYGAVLKSSGWGTADRAFKRRGAHKKLASRFKRLEKLNRWCIDFANKHGYIETIPDRLTDPERGYPIEVGKTDRGTVLETVPLNFRIQGSAMWLTMCWMIVCDRIIRGWNRDDIWEGKYARIIMQVHDEIVFELPRRGNPATDPEGSNLPRVKELVKAMERYGKRAYRIPTPVGIEYHENNWASGVTLK